MSIVDKVKEMLGMHPDQAKQGVEKTGDAADEHTGGKYSDKVDTAQQKADDYIDRGGQDAPSAEHGGEHGDDQPGGGQPG